MSSSEGKGVSVRDLVEEAKKRIVFVIVSVVGLSYLMSLTSSSVLVNLPAALLLIITLRYLSFDIDIRRKSATYNSKQTSANISSDKNVLKIKGLRVEAERSDWKHNVNSPVVEDAIDQFTRHIVSEWVTDLWYSRITPDRQGPEEIVLIMNGVLGVISNRMKNINLIDLLTGDIIKIVCRRLELFRATQAKIERRQSKSLTVEERDIELKSLLAAENKLHPILFSAEAEHKVLQHVVDGLIVVTFRAEDLRCSLFRYIVRELLACVVIRPVLNLANPRFVNERIESFVISRKVEKGSVVTNTTSESRTNAPSDHTTQIADPSVKGVELVQLKKGEKKKEVNSHKSDAVNRELLSKDPLLAMDTQSTRSWNSFPDTHNGEERGLQKELSGGEWANALDVFSRRKTEALAPEHFENMWTMGRGYRRKEDTDTLPDPSQRNSVVGASNSVMQKNGLPVQKNKEKSITVNGKDMLHSGFNRKPEEDNVESLREEEDLESLPSDEDESWSSSYTEEDDMINATGLDSPGVKVWDGKNKRNFSHIHHPLETSDRHRSTKTKNSQLRSTLKRKKSAKKRSRSSTHNGQVWQEVERTSYLLGEGKDVLNHAKVTGKPGDSSEGSEAELLGRTNSGATTSSSSLPESQSLAANSAKTSLIADSYFKLRCEVLGANIVKSGSKTFAVYCISVTDMNSHSWSIKRMYQHFVELHRRLKEFPEYNLHLPPKHFLSTGLDVFVIQERCKLLDQYLKKLLLFPTISCSIEVWDFLSVDSQMYIFSDSLSIIDTLSVDVDEIARPKIKDYRDNVGPVYEQLSSKTEILSHGNQDSASRIKGDQATDGSGLKGKGQLPSSSKKPENEFKKSFDYLNNSSKISEQTNIKRSSNLEKTVDRDHEKSHSLAAEDSSDPMLPSEWVPPNLNVHVFDLVDVILQLKDGGWIRRKAFWVAKQVLQLGMGDAFDDWLIEKIQRLCRGSVVASGIRRLEKILWPDGIFITKHPRRQRPPPDTPSPVDQSSAPYSSPKKGDTLTLEEIQEQEAKRRAKFVYELMIDKAPSAIVGLVGRKEYEQCAKDLYYFIQSSVFMKQLAFDLLKLLLVSSFPELDHVFRELDQDKEKFGKPT
ncbi:uncharacterized protein LOC121797822 isoform X2 [Salvia splendens]|uniref:uncharacterized protein LOC121797822 isoform X2 n=1 Tax=Salvia splendens TaxID=180675 RepID=UPI001C27A3BA|nr:uncharacterized protein LOC121797822 isoform X2 [Salvia splendens]